MDLFHQLQDCEPDQKHKLLASYRRLFHDAATRLPPTRSRDESQAAIEFRALQLKRARKKQFPTLPPRA